MALSNVQFFMCTNQKAKLTMIFSCYLERPRIWQIFPSVQEKRIEQIPGELSRYRSLSFDYFVDKYRLSRKKIYDKEISKNNWSYCCLFSTQYSIFVTLLFTSFVQVSKSAAEFLAAMRIMSSTLPLQPKLQRHLTVGVMTTIIRPSWMGSTRTMNLYTSSLPSGSWISWLHFS